MNCESVHTHWIVLCLRARRTSDDPDLAGLWMVSPTPSARRHPLPGSSRRQWRWIAPEEKSFFLYLFIHFLLKSAVESRGSRADILISGWQSATWMCWRNLGGAAARVGGQRERRVGGVEGLALQREMAACPQAAGETGLDANGRRQQMTTQSAPLKQFTLDDCLWDAPLPVLHCASFTAGEIIEIYEKHNTNTNKL